MGGVGAEIARVLNISLNTCRSHVHAVHTKLGVSTCSRGRRQGPAARLLGRPIGLGGSTGARTVAALVLTAVAFQPRRHGRVRGQHRIAAPMRWPTHCGPRTASAPPSSSRSSAGADGDRAAAADLTTAVASRREDGTLARAVWGRGGVVPWSDDRA